MLFRKYPGLQEQLLKINAATLPPAETGGQKLAIPASLMRGIPKKETWNHDIGIRNGKEALREYTELILHVLNHGGADADASDVVRQQVAQEDTRLIERLMAGERR